MSDPCQTLGPMERGDYDLLTFEKAWGSRPGKIDAARESFGLGETAYYARLAAVIRRPEALAFDPVLVKRLLRLVEGRARERDARRRA